MKRDDVILQNKPWRSEAAIPPELMALKGFLSPEERRLCYWLGRNWLSGRGRAVDVGAYLGAASACLAAGASAAGLASPGNAKLVHAYDRFTVGEQYIADALTRDIRPTQLGDSFLDLFESQTAPYASNIEIHAGELLDQRWTSETIEVLFVDIVTSPDMNAHIVRQFFPSLIPGRSIVVHKGYHHCWHPYIHAGMEYLADEFELVDGVVPYQSRVWRLVSPIPGDKLFRLGRRLIAPDEQLQLLDSLVSKEDPSTRPMLEVARVWQLFLNGDRDWARQDLMSLQQSYGFADRPELWAMQAREVQKYLQD